jgi:hypothetical protein
MPIEIVDRVSSLIEEVGRIERESEVVYLELGKLFPRLSEEMGRSADNGERSVAALAATGEAELKASEGRSGASFVDAAAAYFATLRERDSFFLERINEGISRLGSLEEIIARVRADSEEMEIISLNAMTVALKSGSEGKAFSVITDELKRLSTKTISLSEGVTASGRSLLEFFDRLRGVLAALDSFQRDFFSSIDKTLGSGYADLARSRSDASSFFSKLLGEARSVRDPVLRGMGDIQLQDIVRQSLQHIGISLEEARSSAPSVASPAKGVDDGDLAFIAAVAELSESLIDDVVDKLDAGATAFGSDMDAVSTIVSSCEKKRSSFLFGYKGEVDSVDPGAFQHGSARYLELKRSVMSMSSRLADYVENLDGSFKGLAALLARFQNIVVASRIEVAKTKALAGVANTVGGMITLTDRIATDVGEAMETTKGFNVLAREAMSCYVQGARGSSEEEKLVSTLGAVERDMTGLLKTRDSIRGAIDAFSLYTVDFIELIGRASEELSKLRTLNDRLRAVGSNLGDLRIAIRENLGPEASVVESDRMRRMVERFTIFTHKKAAGDIARFAVETGGEAGEITLF